MATRSGYLCQEGKETRSYQKNPTYVYLGCRKFFLEQDDMK